MAKPSLRKNPDPAKGQRPLPNWLFETRTDAWQEAGIAEEISHGSVRRAFFKSLMFAALFAATLIAFDNRQELLETDQTVMRVVTALLLLGFGWGLADGLGKGLIPALLRRMAPATAGSVGFMIRLLMIGVVAILALRVAGIRAETLIVGGAFTAVIVGLAAQQTLGNVFAGIVLQGTRPFRVGERVRLTGGLVGGPLEGTVGSLGLFYTALVKGSERLMVPNSALLQATVTPLREAESVRLRARFSSQISPIALQGLLQQRVRVATSFPPQVSIEEIERDEVVLWIAATPRHPHEAAQLAEEILAVTRDRFTGAEIDGSGDGATEGQGKPGRGTSSPG